MADQWQGAPLDRLTWPEVAGRREQGDLWLLLPVGSTEQHGPHLPLGTDTIVASHLARRLAAGRDDVVVAPALGVGASGEHAGFPGSLSIGGPALEVVVVELIRSADAFSGVVVVNGHGGNREALRAAAALLASEGRAVLVWSPPALGGDAHAGRSETSMMLALAPERVRLDRARPGVSTPLPELLPRLRAEGVRPVSPSGILGDPTGASAAEGHRLLDAMAADLATVAQAWMRDRGR